MAKEPKAAKTKTAKKTTKAEKPKKAKKSATDELELHDVPVAIDPLQFDIVAYMDTELEVIEKKTKTSADSINRYAERVSTGQLALDMYLNGGIVPGGWYTFSGGEQSCKSTLTMSVMASVIKSQFRGLSLVHDYEGSTDADYVSNQLECFGVKINAQEVFGIQDEETGEWLVRPRIRYYAPSNGEAYFNFMAMLRRSLPDKVVEKNGTAYYIFENNKVNAKKLKGKYDKKWFSKHNQFRVPAPDAQMQVLSIVDSYPAMLPDSQDADDPSGAMAVQARMFSDGIKRFRGGMRRKMITVVGVNQLRQKPATMFGDPAYEPCGDALKFYCFSGDTWLHTAEGRIRASELYEKQGTKPKAIKLESAGGQCSSVGIRIVDDARQACRIYALGHMLEVSTLHRTMTFGENKGQLRPEYKTFENLVFGRDAAVFRLPESFEVMERPDFAETLKSVVSKLSGLNSTPRRLTTPVGRIKGYIAATLPAGSREVSDLLAEMLYCGIFGFEQMADGNSDRVNVIVPMPKDTDVSLYEALKYGQAKAVKEGIDVHQNYARHVMSMAAIQNRYPDLHEAIDEINFSRPFADWKLLQNIDEMMREFDGLLTKELAIESVSVDDYDRMIEQLAYVEDLFSSVDPCAVPLLTSSGHVLAGDHTLYDVAVPETQAVVTNGIISHNSDVRIRLTSRAIPAGWKGEAGVVQEDSVTVEKGIDRYRFIAARTIKNKLGGVPNQTTWLRLWESDGLGKARGFDPVFDTYHYLKTLGVISGTRNRMKFEKPCPLYDEKAKAITWDQFRTLINGSKQQIVEVCKFIGCKPVGLRLWAFKFVNSEKGRNALRDTISKRASGAASSEDDDE